MPFYEYQCGSCRHRLEVLQKMSDDPLLYCPECNESALKKLVSAAAFRLKGSGWYETDFKDNDKKKENASDGKSNASQSSDDKMDNKNSSSKPAETKPDNKSVTKSDTSSTASSSESSSTSA